MNQYNDRRPVQMRVRKAKDTDRISHHLDPPPQSADTAGALVEGLLGGI